MASGAETFQFGSLWGGEALLVVAGLGIVSVGLLPKAHQHASEEAWMHYNSTAFLAGIGQQRLVSGPSIVSNYSLTSTSFHTHLAQMLVQMGVQGHGLMVCALGQINS